MRRSRACGALAHNPIGQWSPRGGKRITADPAGRYRNLRFVNYSLTKRAFGDRPPAFEFSLSRRSILSPRDSVAHPVRTLPPLGGAGAVFLNTFKTLYTHQCAPASLASPRDGRREGVVGGLLSRAKNDVYFRNYNLSLSKRTQTIYRRYLRWMINSQK